MSNRVEIRVRNVDCENEAAAISRGLVGFPGLSALEVYAKAGEVVACTREAWPTRRASGTSASLRSAGPARRIGSWRATAQGLAGSWAGS